MSNGIGKICTILLAAFLMITIPVMAMEERAKTAVQLYLLTEETEFIDSVCNIGFLNQNMYEQFQNKLFKLPGIYEIEIVVERKELQYENDKVSYVSRFFDTKDVEQILKEQGMFSFYRNDFVRLCVTRKDGKQLFLFGMDGTVCVYYGGTIKYEAY